MMLAYFDLFSGISGDMTLAAFVDLGVPVDWLAGQLARLPLAGFRLSAAEVSLHGIAAKRVKVELLEESAPRDYSTIRELIGSSPLPQRVKDRSLAVFDRIAAAEAAIHRCPKEKVHFHELGGVDAIADIVGCALCLEYLDIEAVECSAVPLGSGFVASRHGILPVPAPATLAILNNVPVYGSDIPFELVTPTGAGIVAGLARAFGKMSAMRPERVGYGAGTYEFETAPNLLRIVIGKAPAKTAADSETIVVIEAAVDDMNPEIFGYVMERLFAAGALDVALHPIYMKKNRPGTLLQVLCRRELKDALIDCMLAETTSLGVRYYEARRRTLERESAPLKTSLGTVQVKKARDLSGAVRIVPEFEVCRQIALQRQIPLRVVYETVLREAAEMANDK